MKKIHFIIPIMLLLSVVLSAQINMNPDPNGVPWWAGGGKLLPPETEALIPELVLSSQSIATDLPSEVYNDELQYFPPVFNQKGNSCVQAAEISYTFSYEINRLRNVPAGVWISEDPNDFVNVYHHLYTYN